AARIEQIAKSTAEAFGGTIEFLMDWGAAPVINTPENAAFAAEAVKEIFGDNMQTSRPAPNMAGEDFAEYLAKVPGAFMFLSSSNPAKHTDVAHHNSKFDVDEDVLWMGSAAFVAITEKFLNA
ncbi:MAG: M20/M25/M40 family metallo-hydrolase, partial [Synergistaceae bacterium]|nr:M20/M25/M40 family metallo-hydrolase [Synergistaceae bacterium]